MGKGMLNIPDAVSEASEKGNLPGFIFGSSLLFTKTPLLQFSKLHVSSVLIQFLKKKNCRFTS